MNGSDLLQIAKELSDHIQQTYPHMTAQERDAVLTLALIASSDEDRAARLLSNRGFYG